MALSRHIYPGLPAWANFCRASRSTLPQAGSQGKTALVRNGAGLHREAHAEASASAEKSGGQALRFGTAESQDESHCSAIHKQPHSKMGWTDLETPQKISPTPSGNRNQPCAMPMQE
jgi:hypothetical protein